MIKKRVRNTLVTSVSAFCLAAGGWGAIASADSPNSNSDNKVTICHRTDSVTHPYNRISVDASAADGNTGNDNGQGDHSQHTGPVATTQTVAQRLKDNHEMWGDIIPPHDNYGGLNWDASGQAVYNNGCNYVTPGQGGGTTTNTTTTLTPAPTVATTGQGVGGVGAAQVVVPSGSVAAGEGGGTNHNVGATIAGLGASITAALTGIGLLVKKNLLHI